MTKHEKIAFLYENFQGEWIATRVDSETIKRLEHLLKNSTYE